MYRLKKEWFDFFKEIRTNVYSKYIGCIETHASSILNGKKPCSENLAKSFISVREDISFKNEQMPTLLEKYFAKEK